MTDLLTLPHLATVEIFLLLPGQSLHNCRQVCKSWNKFIIDNIWMYPYAKDILEKRLENNWFRNDSIFEETELAFDVGTPKPYLLTAAEDFIVVQNHPTCQEFLKLFVYNVKTNDVWKIDAVDCGPYSQEKLKSDASIDVKINENILSIWYDIEKGKGNYRKSKTKIVLKI